MVASPVVTVVTVALALALGGCGTFDDSTAEVPTATSSPARTEAAEQQHPDVIDVVAEQQSAGVFAFTVTISSPYDTPDRYADGWRIVGPNGTVYGEHTLTHDHANEQPFTRVQRDVVIPSDVDEVTVEGRDLEYGYGGATVTVAIDS